MELLDDIRNGEKIVWLEDTYRVFFSTFENNRKCMTLGSGRFGPTS